MNEDEIEREKSFKLFVEITDSKELSSILIACRSPILAYMIVEELNKRRMEI